MPENRPNDPAFDHLVESHDFIELGLNPRIYLEGLDPEAVWALVGFVSNGLSRQFTDSADQLCALYALEVSLQNMYPGESPNFGYLRALWQSDEYQRLASHLAGLVDNNESISCELFASRNLSVNVILIILRILGSRMGKVFDLGICEPVIPQRSGPDGIPLPIFTVYRLRASEDEVPTATVWLHNDRNEEIGQGIGHWSGFGVDRQAQSGYLAPKFILQVDSSNTSNFPVADTTLPPADVSVCPSSLSYSASGLTYSTFDISYPDSLGLHSVNDFDRNLDIGLSPRSYRTSETPSSVQMSRTTSTDSKFRDLHAPTRPNARARSRSPSNSAGREPVQCTECQKHVQAKGYR